MFDVSFIRRIGLLDKLVQVSSPILLALQLIDIKNSQCVFSTAAVLSSAAHLPIKYLKLKHDDYDYGYDYDYDDDDDDNGNGDDDDSDDDISFSLLITSS